MTRRKRQADVFDHYRCWRDALTQETRLMLDVGLILLLFAVVCVIMAVLDL